MHVRDLLAGAEDAIARFSAKEKSRAQVRLKKIMEKYDNDLLMANVLITSREGSIVCGSTSYGKRFVWAGSGLGDYNSLFGVTLSVGDKPVFANGAVEKALEYLTNEGLFKKLAA